MGYSIFLLVNAILLIRPAEIIPALENLPIYNGLISVCMIMSMGKLTRQLSVPSLIENPISLCVVGLFFAVIFSHLSHLNLNGAKDGALEFGKILLYYLLLVSVVDTPDRLRCFLWVLVGSTVVLILLALCQYHGVVDLPALRPIHDRDFDENSGSKLSVVRLCGAGIYHDPNDLCLLLLMSMGICLYGLGDSKQGLLRFSWLAPFLLFGYALTRTHSKGGFLALLGSMTVLFTGRFGWRKALPLVALALPVAFVVFAGRQTHLSTSSGTGQDRIQIWSQGLDMFRQYPLFGVGQNRYADVAGIVAHNSYLHSVSELGLFGGIFFIGSLYYALSTLTALGRWASYIPDPEMRRLRPYLLAIVTSYSICILALSRNYVVPTYLVLGLVTVYLREATKNSRIRAYPLGLSLCSRFALSTLAVLGVVYVVVRLLARFGS